MIQSDFRLRKHIEDELRWEPSVNGAAVGVGVRDAIVTLSGNVENYAQKHTVAEIVSGIHGVRGMANELLVKLPTDSERSDEDIAHTIASMLTWNSLIPKDRVKVQVAQGWVTLEGRVDWHYQRAVAESSVRNLMGVRGIHNLITVKPVVPQRPAGPNLEEALQRSGHPEAGKVSARLSGPALRLSGKVPTLAAKMDVEYIAWKTPGVSRVENELEVDPAVEVMEFV